MINLGGIGKAISKVVSAPFKIVGSLLGGNTANVSAPDVSAVDIVPSTASSAPEAPVLGTTKDKDKKKRGKSRLLINNDSSPSSGNSSYSGLNI